MDKFTAEDSICWVFTYKEGLLSAVAHDLKLEVGRFEVDVDLEAKRVSATFGANSLRVACARVDGADAPGKLSGRDQGKIEKIIAKDVLNSNRYPDVRFVSAALEQTGPGWSAHGTLTLHGVARELQLTAQRANDRWRIRTSLHQPDFGIQPYRAAMGTLRIQPDVDIELLLPAGAEQA